MTRSPSAEPSKATTKRKGTRSVSSLTPSQLARKRANDREAQRAIRARTKEHIESLSKQLEELKSKQSRDQTVQTLLRKNRALEDELFRLKESMGISPAQTYATPPVYEENLSAHAINGAVSSPRSSAFQSGTDFTSMPADLGTSFIPMGEATEPWTSTIPYSVPSTVSSPSSTSNLDDIGQSYIPTSIPPSLMEEAGLPPTSHLTLNRKLIKTEYDDLDNEPPYARAPSLNSGLSHPQSYLHHQPWNLVPVYFPRSPVH